MSFRLLLSVIICLASVGCGESSFNLASGRQDYFLMSVDKEIRLGRKIAEAIEKEMEVFDNAEEQARIREIGERIVAVCDRQELEYRFKILEAKELNAFSLPGGFVYVYSGLIEKTKNEDELAGVIAHEIAHIAARHAARRYRSHIGTQLLQLATLIARQPEAAAGSSIIISATQLSHARDEEIEADRLAIRYMEQAGFDPEAFLSFLDTMQAEGRKITRYLPGGYTRPQYGRTHPYIPERRVAVKEELYGVASYIDYLNVQE